MPPLSVRTYRAALLVPALLAAAAAPATAGNAPFPYRVEEVDRNPAPSRRFSGGLQSHLFDDTVAYGGTRWAPDSLRWEALRDSHWSFDSGIASWLNNGQDTNKPVGYHQSMEGWTGLDRTVATNAHFRRSSLCAITGSFSLWAGLAQSTADSLCYAAGAGYGNSWNLAVSKSFAYPGAGNVTFQYRYAVEAEPAYDYAYVLVDTTGNGTAPDLVLAVYDGVTSGLASFTLNPGADMRSSPGAFTLRFRVTSDPSYSDEDGLYPSLCGHSAFDDITLSGAVTDTAGFESGADGWSLELPMTGVGDYSDLADLADLPTTHFTVCPCGLEDSVLVFYDELQEHPLDQDNLATSPWIDLERGGDGDRSGRVVMCDVYAELPLANYIFVQVEARYAPYACPVSGALTVSPFRSSGGSIFTFGEVAFCNPGDTPQRFDVSSVIPAGVEEAQLALGVVSFCATAPFGPPCTGLSNTTPWFDNVSLGVYGSTSTPPIAVSAGERFQDNFAADGTVNPASAGRIDVNRVKGGTAPTPGSILGDTLTAAGDGGNTEVRLVFRVRTGPFVNSAGYAAQAARWTLEPLLAAVYGGTWYSARMDTAEQGGSQLGVVKWMSTFHESDPGFLGNDRSPDPFDPNRLANDILPDHLFTPGSRIDYFVTGRFRPPDPRNPGGTAWQTDPDTIGGHFREVEILPSSMGADTSWNCTLYVDHHDDRAFDEQALEEQGLALALGPGGGNAEGTRYDRFDNQAPSSNHLSFGRPLGSVYGAGSNQVFAYKTIAWHSAAISSGQLTTQDVNVLNPWLTTASVGNNRFWGSGNGLATSMHAAGGTPRSFLNNTLGVVRTCDTIRLANCPAGSPADSTYCLPTAAVAGAHFATLPLPRGRGNNCPEFLSFDLLGVNAAVTTATGQLSWVKSGVERPYASVTNFNTANVDFKTVLDGAGVGRWRGNPGTYLAGCDDVTPARDRSVDVLDWFGSVLTCRPFHCCSDVPAEGPPAPAAFRHALGVAMPNPAAATTRIHFTNGVASARVVLELFDVTGRRVRTLIDGALPAGPHEVAWDGRADDGRAVAAGLYFYRMTAEGFQASDKLLVVR